MGCRLVIEKELAVLSGVAISVGINWTFECICRHIPATSLSTEEGSKVGIAGSLVVLRWGNLVSICAFRQDVLLSSPWLDWVPHSPSAALSETFLTGYLSFCLRRKPPTSLRRLWARGPSPSASSETGEGRDVGCWVDPCLPAVDCFNIKLENIHLVET